MTRRALTIFAIVTLAWCPASDAQEPASTSDPPTDFFRSYGLNYNPANTIPNWYYGPNQQISSEFVSPPQPSKWQKYLAWGTLAAAGVQMWMSYENWNDRAAGREPKYAEAYNAMVYAVAGVVAVQGAVHYYQWRQISNDPLAWRRNILRFELPAPVDSVITHKSNE